MTGLCMPPLIPILPRAGWATWAGSSTRLSGCHKKGKMTMMNTVYLPDLSGGRFVRSYFFRHPQRGPCSCVLVTDCKNSSRVQYAHVMYVYEGGDFLTGRPCLAVASEVNRMASAGSGRSHFLGLFPGEGHVNLGAADEWAEMEKFAAKALEVIAEQFSLPKPPEQMDA